MAATWGDAIHAVCGLGGRLFSEMKHRPEYTQGLEILGQIEEMVASAAGISPEELRMLNPNTLLFHEAEELLHQFENLKRQALEAEM